MRSKRNIFFVFFVFSFFLLKAQSKELKAILKEAKVIFEAQDYYNAIPKYRKALSIDSKNEKAGLYLAVCMFKLDYPVDSIYFLTQNLTSSSLIDSRFYLGKISHQQNNFDEALDLLEKYLKVSSKKRMHTDMEVQYMIDVCKNGKKFVSNPHRSVIKNIGSEINSSAPDYVPVVLPDESALFFTSRREGSSNNKRDVNGMFYEDVYVSYREGDKWKKAENIGPPVNSETNDACVSVSPDGQRIIVYRASADKRTGDLYITKTSKDNKWEPIQKMVKEVNSQFIETSACFSNDTSEIYFTSNRPGGYGGKDIYRLKKLPNGKWAVPFNLGPKINSKYDEESPFLHPDGVTLFFSSKGHNTMGEYDVYRSILNPDNNTFSEPENLGYPINSVSNDMFFVLSVDGQRAYYSSIKDDTYGGNDIYEIDTRYGDNDLKVKAGTAFLGDQYDRLKITLFDNESKTINGVYSSNPKTGRFILVMNPLKTYKAIVEHEGYKTLVVELGPLAFEKDDSDLEFKLEKKK